jgi:hypothetical protein
MKDCSTLHGHGKPHRQPHPLARFFPLVEVFGAHRLQDYGTDLLAGIIISVVLIPETIAYASLAGLPAYMGLYTAIVAFLDARAITDLDTSGDKVLWELLKIMMLKEVHFLVAAVTKPVVEVMRRSGFYDFLGPENFYHALPEAVAAIEQRG